MFREPFTFTISNVNKLNKDTLKLNNENSK